MADRSKSPGWKLFPRPTTGDGYTSGQKPKLSQTNLNKGKDGFLAPLIRRAIGGKHQGK